MLKRQQFTVIYARQPDIISPSFYTQRHWRCRQANKQTNKQTNKSHRIDIKDMIRVSEHR
ncbi:hypothetical protein A9312_09220 [Yersinia pestis]|nr:conserved hypothetical protein [Yersinia pestis biovar Orientalis str. F1991016]PVF34995.1 hypothetical protein A9312_09220 [Yersinia pestis]PVU40304.1 hypothetical protein A8P50_06985 [Yersinia pestis]